MPAECPKHYLSRASASGRIRTVVCALALAGCSAVGTTPPATGPVAGHAPSTRAVVEQSSLQQAMQAAHPRTGNPARAKALLEALLADTDDAYARTLLEQINERQRLDAVNQRLTQQLERATQQTKDSQQRADDLQRKIDALADIERTPPARAPKRALTQ